MAPAKKENSVNAAPKGGSKTAIKKPGLEDEIPSQDVQSGASAKVNTSLKLRLNTNKSSPKATRKAAGNGASPAAINTKKKAKSKATSIASENLLSSSALEESPDPINVTMELQSKSPSQISAAEPSNGFTNIPHKTKSNKRANRDPEGQFSSKRAKAATDTPNTERSTKNNDSPAKSVNFDESPSPVFCCADVKATDPNALYTCDNSTCLCRHMLKIFVAYMKKFDWHIPLEENTENSKFLLQISRYEPMIGKEVSTTRIKRGVTREWGQNEPGRYFVKAEEDAGVTFAEVSFKEDIIPLEWEKVVMSEMEFACEMHEEVKYKAFYWKHKEVATKA